MNSDGTYNEKKLLGSGGYASAKLTDEVYYCNKCLKEYQGSPKIAYENPNGELGDDVILLEKGE
jgi:hypothetical protein